MHDRVGKLFQTLRQPFLRNGMSLTLMSKANESQLEPMSKLRVPRSSQIAAKTNEERNVSLPELRRLAMKGTKIVVFNTNETNPRHTTENTVTNGIILKRVYGQEERWGTRVKHLQESHDRSVSQTLISYAESCGYRLFAGSASFVNTISWKPCFNVS